MSGPVHPDKHPLHRKKVTTTTGVTGTVTDWFERVSGESLWSPRQRSDAPMLVEYAYRTGAAGLPRDEESVLLYLDRAEPWDLPVLVLVHDSEIVGPQT